MIEINGTEVMTAKDLISVLSKYNPDTPLISASDDEGNSHSYVIFSPTVGEFDESTGDFIDIGTLAECKQKVSKKKFDNEIDESISKKIAQFKGEKTICIN